MTNPRILIVEDDATLSEQITQLLQSRGFETRHEFDGHAGLEAVLVENFDLILQRKQIRKKRGTLNRNCPDVLRDVHVLISGDHAAIRTSSDCVSITSCKGNVPACAPNIHARS